MSSFQAYQDAIANKTLDDMNKHYKESSANTGTGSLGPWPGEDPAKKTDYDEYYTCAVRLEINTDAKFKWGDKQETPAMQLQFKLEAELPEGAFPFNGQPATIPYDISNLPEESDKAKGGKQQTRVSIAQGRMKGSLETLLGVEYDSLTDAIGAFLKKQDEADAANIEIQAKVKLEFRYRTFKNRRENTETTRLNKEEYIQELVQSVE